MRESQNNGKKLFCFTVRKPKTIEFITVLLCLVILLSTVTYSWIRRKWSPRIGQDNIQIMAGNSLVFSLVGHGFDNTQIISINDKIGNIILRPVSNYSGTSEDFFTLNADVYGGEYFTHLKPGGALTHENYTKLGQDNGYIEITFLIQGKDTEDNRESYTKFVFLSTDTDIWIDNTELTDDQKLAYKALRVSLTFDETTLIFVPKESDGSARVHKAIDNSFVVKNGEKYWCADGVRYNSGDDHTYAEYDEANKRWRTIKYFYDTETSPRDLIKTNNDVEVVSTFSEFMGGYNHGSQFVQDEALFSIDPGQQKTITVRIWLEGEDEYCTSKIKGSFINFLMGFESYNVEITGGETTAAETTKKVVDE